MAVPSSTTLLGQTAEERGENASSSSLLTLFVSLLLVFLPLPACAVSIVQCSPQAFLTPQGTVTYPITETCIGVAKLAEATMEIGKSP